MSRLRTHAVTLWALLSLATVGVAHADGGNVRSAAEEYDAGRRAYRAGDFAEAARAFEAAYREAPNAEALRAALVARHKAGQLARAATLATFGQGAHPNDEALQSASAEVLEAAQAQLASISVQCAPACALVVDGQLVNVVDAEASVVYVEPGEHALRVEWPDKTARTLKVNSVAGVRFERSVKKPAPPPPPPSEPPPSPAVTTQQGGPLVAPEPEAKRRGGLPKGVFFTSLGLTLAAGAATGVSGALALTTPGRDTVRRECRGLGAECEAYKDGQAAELRTNILIGATAGLAAITTVFAIFTDFSGKNRGKAQLTPLADPERRSAGLSFGGQF